MRPDLNPGHFSRSPTRPKKYFSGNRSFDRRPILDNGDQRMPNHVHFAALLESGIYKLFNSRTFEEQELKAFRSDVQAPTSVFETTFIVVVVTSNDCSKIASNSVLKKNRK